MKFNYVLVILVLFFMAFLGKSYSDKALAFKFVDEQYNFTIGKYLSWGEVLYTDLISNHQPITHIFSYQTQNLTSPPNIFLLLKKHRQAVAVWSFVWALILVLYFGLGSFFFIILFEISKFHLLGNLFLAESFASYPLVFLIGMVFFLSRKLSRIEHIFFGLTIGLLGLTLGPIWPTLLVLMIMFGFKQKITIHNLLYTASGLVIAILYILNFSSFWGYIKYYLFANLVYTIPVHQHEPFLIVAAKSLITPFLSFLPLPQTPTLLVIRILTVLLLINTFITKRFKKFLLLLCILGATNLRFINPGTEGYDGFHILPWYSAFLFCTLMFIRKTLVNLLIIAFVIIFSINSAKTLFTKDDSLKQYSINYSTQESVGNTIRQMKKPNDTLFVSQDAYLIYWQADIAHLPYSFGYYSWMSGIPDIHTRVLQSFEENPPTFFYCDNCQGLDLARYLPKYRHFKKIGSPDNLYILNKHILEIAN